MSDNVIERFLEKIICEPSCCWLWAGGLSGGGYAHFWNGQKQVRAHRFAYESYVGGIPDGLDLDHLCRVRSCVNPAHLEPVTRKENMRRGIHHESRKTHCVKGHPLEGPNAHVRPNGHRMCRTCHNEHNRQARRRRKASPAAAEPATEPGEGVGRVVDRRV